MGERRAFSCDVAGCTAEKREVNHWWICWHESSPTGGTRVFCSGQFNERLWDAVKKEERCMNASIACGAEHAQLIFSRWLANGTFEARERGFEERGTGHAEAASKGEK